MATAGKVITCKAAVAWEPHKPLVIEDVEVAVPKAGEVRMKIRFCGVCHSDAHVVNGRLPECKFPIILGHEASGIVESVGEGVTEFKPGDHVIPSYVPQCDDCRSCKNPNTNLCDRVNVMDQGLMPDGTSRFTCRGKAVSHFLGCSAFSEYTVVPAFSVSKINPAAPLEKVCLIGCGVPTGYGAAVNTAQVAPGSTCAVFGLGGIGLAAVMGARNAGAARVIGIDINPEKFDLAKRLGATECINPKDFDKPIQQVLIEKTDGGPDSAIECIGNIATMKAALEATHQGWGVAVIIGLAASGEQVSVPPIFFTYGRSMKGSFFGGYKGKHDIPQLVEDYLAKKIHVDEFVTHTMDLDHINKAFDLMKEGKSLRSVVTISK